MNNFSKAQVLALFLGTASAQGYTALQVLNGSFVDNTANAAAITAMTSTGTVCNGPADCTATGEKCAAFQTPGDAATVNYCLIDTYFCGAIGRMNNIPFAVQCWEAPADGATAVAPAKVDAAAWMTSLEDLITKSGENWDSVTDILVSPRFDYQDGWFIPKVTTTEGAAPVTTTTWVETDKEIDNRCFLDSQCPNKCCATYPDSNNRRCIEIAAHNVAVTVGPLSFTPICLSQVAPADGASDEPDAAIDDVAAGALTEAAEALTTWSNNNKEQAQTDAKYADMTDAEKTAWDSDYSTQKDKEDAFITKMKTAAGYDALTVDQQTVWLTDLNTWQKAIYEVCKTDKNGIACRKANELRETDEAARKEDGYYAKSKEDRAVFVKAQNEKNAQAEASLAAAWREEGGVPDSGLEGGKCAGEGENPRKCNDPTLCCGVYTPVTGQAVTAKINDRCGRGITSTSAKDGQWDNGLGELYTHVCQAKKVAATFAAGLVAAYSLM